MTKMSTPNVVRGKGLFDVPLAKLRGGIAHKKLRQVQNRGHILDIGCGNYPYFLMNVDFSEKFGLEKNISFEAMEIAGKHNIKLVSHDIEDDRPLPFEGDFFDAVTMMAVFEHIEPSRLLPLHKEIRRILKVGGLFIMTTPAPHTDGLLRALASLKLVSAEEINDHKGAYSPKTVAQYLEAAGFNKDDIQSGYFELFLNGWVCAKK